jgi:dethiobiotin synthetase
MNQPWLNEKRVFVTGTDTEVGKTFVSVKILQMYARQGIRAGYFKPVATGGIFRDSELVSEDVLTVERLAGIREERSRMNPVCYEIPAAPLIAAELSGRPVSLTRIRLAYEELRDRCESFVVEGIGGIMVPLTEETLVVDLVREFGLPVVIVTRPVLGTINHTALTVRILKDMGIRILGLVVTSTTDKDPGIAVNASFDVLRRMTGLPVLREFPYEMEKE